MIRPTPFIGGHHFNNLLAQSMKRSNGHGYNYNFQANCEANQGAVSVVLLMDKILHHQG